MKKRLHRISPNVKHPSHSHLQKIAENLRAKTGHSVFVIMESVSYAINAGRQSFGLSLVAEDCYYNNTKIKSYQELYSEYQKLMKG